LNAIEQGDPRATEELLPLIYDELRLLAAQKLANEPPGQTLQATALVHEAYIRLIGVETGNWNSRNHFFMSAAEAMRRILIETEPEIRVINPELLFEGLYYTDSNRSYDVSRDGQRF
jgi:RNA polymerase sigma factor (TIGR02999 family)